MRIEQPLHLRSKRSKSLWLTMREHLLRMARKELLFSALGLDAMIWASLAVQVAVGKSVFAWQWISAAFVGPFFMGIFLPGSLRFLMWATSWTQPWAEIRGGLVHLNWTAGGPFPVERLISCKIEPDPHFDDTFWLTIYFKKFQFGGPLQWMIMVEDLREAKAFQQELERLALKAT